MTNLGIAHWQSPVGTLAIGIRDDAVCSLSITNTKYDQKSCSPLAEACIAQLREFFSGRRTTFDLPVAPAGTPFQRAVWEAICSIPKGETRTYGQVASMIGKPSAARAVGQALHRNPVCIIIPCHRVTAGDGTPGGFAYGRTTKQRLLAWEAAA